jgi:hypothetical protein
LLLEELSMARALRLFFMLLLSDATGRRWHGATFGHGQQQQQQVHDLSTMGTDALAKPSRIGMASSITMEASGFVGKAAPAWAATAHTGDTVTGSGLAGQKYLIWFYPKADTGG